MSTFDLTEEARQQYYEAYAFIESYSQRAAEQWEARMIDAFLHLGRWPRSGRLRNELAPPNLRFWVVGDYIILYDFTVQPVMVLSIVHGARDIDTILEASDFEDSGETHE